MEAFSSAGPGGDAAAALALVRALIRALHKAGNIAITFPLSSQECFQLLGDDLIQHRRFGIARPVRDVDSHEGARNTHDITQFPT